jgi:hypothetical protein
MSIESHKHSDRADPGDHQTHNARGLHDEALDELSSARGHRRRSRVEPIELDENGDYQVQKGDTLWKIAQRNLERKGKNSRDKNEVWEEMAHIATDNLINHPEVYHTAQVDPSMTLKLEGARNYGLHGSERSGANERKALEFVRGHKVARDGERVVALEGAKVVLHKGSEGTIEAGATGFGFPGSKAKVHDGGKFIAAGGEVEASPGALIMQGAPSKIAIVETEVKVAKAEPVAKPAETESGLMEDLF